MEIHTDIPLKNYTTMKLGGNARFMTAVRTPADVAEICKRAREQNLPIFVLGGGSNTIVRDEGFDGIVIHNKIPGFHVVSETSTDVVLKIGAGENWDEFVKRTVELGLTGVEALSAIPGCVGGAPVQNVGAYGQEVAETIVSVEAYDTQTDTVVALENSQCNFSYRNSIFRDTDMGRYVIIAVVFKLYKSAPQPPFYKAVQDYLDANNITVFTPQVIRDAVIAIRTEKLPDPKVQPNTGSFFKNVVVEKWILDEIKQEYPDVPNYDMGNDTFKIPTGWLIEQTGLKGQVMHGMKVHDKNALVLINESATSYADLAAAREQIITAVRDKFRITIEQEPLEI